MFVLDKPVNDFSKNLDTHKVSFRLDSEISENKQETFRHKKAVLFISVGQLYHESGKFFATIELLNKYQFSQCDIVMADTLQRFNHFGRMSESEALNYTRLEGDNWLKRNQVALRCFEIKHNIIRWDELLNHPDYASLKEIILQEYQTNPAYQKALHANVETYIERLKIINPNCEVNNLFQFGVNYLIEECPIVIPLWAKMGYDYIIYPKPLSVGMAATRNLFLEPTYHDKCQWVFLRFKKR